MSKPHVRHQKKRREKFLRLGRNLSWLATHNPKEFQRKWSIRVTSWLVEIDRRGRQTGRGTPSTDQHLHVFAVYEDVEFLLRSFLPIDQLVGRQTRSELQAACARAVAASADARMYRLVSTYQTIAN